MKPSRIVLTPEIVSIMQSVETAVANPRLGRCQQDREGDRDKIDIPEKCAMGINGVAKKRARKRQRMINNQVYKERSTWRSGQSCSCQKEIRWWK